MKSYMSVTDIYSLLIESDSNSSMGSNILKESQMWLSDFERS
jgi:hypothetical protein